MEKRIRLAAIDMDGTLLSPDGTVSPANQAAIRALKNQGAEVVVCTGRSFRDASRPLRAAKIVCGLICMNGAAVYRKDGSLSHRQTISAERINRILCLAKEFDLVTDLMGEDKSYTTVSEERFRKGYEEGILLPMVESNYRSIRERFTLTVPEAILQKKPDIFKISVMHKETTVLDRVKKILEKEGGLALASSDRTNVEITSGLAQKGIALMEYAKEKHYHLQEIMAIGDSGNDVSMLSLPLGATVAMGNAMPEAKRAAMYETRTNREDGVAWAIENWAIRKWETA